MEENYPVPIITIGKRGKVKNPNGKVVYFTIEDEIRRVASIGPGDKYIYLQKIKFDNGNIELRLGYYIIGKKGRMKGKWTWGQFAPFIPIEDFRYIIDKAGKRGWLNSKTR